MTEAGDGMTMMMMPPPSSAMPMPMPPGGDHDMGMGKRKMMMHMTFFWGHRVEILFSGWPGDHGVGMYLLALLAVFVASVLVEAFTYVPHSRMMMMSGRQGQRVSKSKGLVLTGLAAVRSGLSYLVMLAVMSFNVGVLIVAIAGHALGFFVFGCGIFKWSTGTDGVLPSKC